MKEYLNEFIYHLKLNKKSSNNTIESYKRDVSKYLSYLDENNVKDSAAVSDELITRYISSLAIEGKSSSTITRVGSSIKGYYKFLNSLNASFSVPKFKSSFQLNQDKKFPVILEISEIQKLLDQPDMNDIKGIRDRAMLETLYATGIKVSELISLNIDDVNLQSDFIKSGNGKNARIIPIHKTAAKMLSLYINQIRPVLVNDVTDLTLFVNMNGSSLTRQGLWKILKSYAVSAGIDKEITPHTIRHSFAYHLLENGADLNDIKDLLGHVDISSTQIYSQMIKSNYAKSYTKFHPLAR